MRLLPPSDLHPPRTQLCDRRSERLSLPIVFKFEALHGGNSTTSAGSPQSPNSRRTVAEQSPMEKLIVSDTSLFQTRHFLFVRRTVGDCGFFHRGVFGDCTGTVRRLFGDCLNSHRSPGARGGRQICRRRRSKLGRRADEYFRTRHFHRTAAHESHHVKSSVCASATRGARDNAGAIAIRSGMPRRQHLVQIGAPT